jgi:regulator of sirC expression with transglutaminase-like and TPR domain
MSDTTLIPQRYRDMLKLLGYIYLQNGKTEKAAILFAAVHAVDPLDQSAAESLAYAYLRSGAADKALRVVDHFGEQFPVSALSHLLRSQALGATGHKAEAARSMRKFVLARTQEERIGGL